MVYRTRRCKRKEQLQLAIVEMRPCHTSARLPQAKRRLDSCCMRTQSALPGQQRDWRPTVIGQGSLGSAGPAWLRSQRSLGDLRVLPHF